MEQPDTIMGDLMVTCSLSVSDDLSPSSGYKGSTGSNARNLGALRATFKQMGTSRGVAGPPKAL